MLTNKNLYVIFKNQSLKIQLYDNPLSNYLYDKFKHLKHIPLMFNDADIYFNPAIQDFDIAKKFIIKYATELDIQIQEEKLNTQSYLNSLHEIYEKKFNGESRWLKFHEHIHILEKILFNYRFDPIISFDYRTMSGKVEKSFSQEYYNYSTTHVLKNQCFLRWQELGKTPYQYFLSQEPYEIKRICELAKPWVTLRPSFHVSCENFDCLAEADLDSFDSWFENYKEDWVKYWNIPNWSSIDIFKIIVIGEIESADTLVDNIKSNNMPLRISNENYMYNP